MSEDVLLPQIELRVLYFTHKKWELRQSVVVHVWDPNTQEGFAFKAIGGYTGKPYFKKGKLSEDSTESFKDK